METKETFLLTIKLSDDDFMLVEYQDIEEAQKEYNNIITAMKDNQIVEISKEAENILLGVHGNNIEYVILKIQEE